MNSVILLKILLAYIFLSCGDAQNNEQTDSQAPKKGNSDPKPITYQCDYLNQETPDNIPRLFSPHVISTGKEHSAVMMSPDGLEMWFGRMFPAKIWMLTKENGAWSQPRIAPLNEDYNFLYPILSPNGNKIYFTSDKPITPGGPRLPRGEGDIWFCERKAEGWSKPIHMGEKINFGIRNSVGSVSKLGNLYYTARTGTGADKRTNIYMAKFENNTYATPTKIGELSGDQPSHCPFLAPDESYLIFSSFRAGQGLSDLFICFKDSTGQWTNPKNLGPKINSSAKDEYPFVTPDGKYLFFNSNRISEMNDRKIQDGPGNMFWVSADFISEMRTAE